MNTAGDASDKIVAFLLEGTEVAFRITGEGARNIGAVICAMMKESKQTRGKTRLTNLLKTGKELKIYSFKAEDLKTFSQEAKQYGVLYCVLAHKKNQKLDGIVDVMIREEDAAKVNRISERFAFADVDRAVISRELGLDKEQENKMEKERDLDALVDDILSNTKTNEERIEQAFPSNENTEEKSQLEKDLNMKQKDKGKNKQEEKKSVREELKQIEKELVEKEKSKVATNENKKESKEKATKSKGNKSKNKKKSKRKVR